TGPQATAFGGVLNITPDSNNDGGGTLNPAASLTDQDYYNSRATRRQLLSCTPTNGVTGTVSPPTSLGVVTITLYNPTGSTCFGLSPALQPSIQFTGYIVSANEIRLIETDDSDGQQGFLTAGVAEQQNIPAGGFTVASFDGSYAFGVLGEDGVGVNSASPFLPSSFTSAGVLNPDGSGNLTTGAGGEADALFSAESAAFTANPATPLTGTYTIDTSGIGRVGLTLQFPTPPAPSPRPNF